MKYGDQFISMTSKRRNSDKRACIHVDQRSQLNQPQGVKNKFPIS